MSWKTSRPQAGAADAGGYIGLSEFATAAGGGAVVDDEQITGRLRFHRAWLDRHGLIARGCRVIQVLGQSMEPTNAAISPEGDMYVTVRNFRTYDDKPEWHGTTLFLNGLDESRARVQDGRSTRRQRGGNARP